MFEPPSRSPILLPSTPNIFWSSTISSPPARPSALPHKRWSAPERPPYGWLRWPERAAPAVSVADLLPPSRMWKTASASPATHQPRIFNRQAYLHRRTNHLFDEGKRDVAGKSYDSCSKAEVHCQGRRVFGGLRGS